MTTTTMTDSKVLSPNVYPFNINKLPYQENLFFNDKSISNIQPHLRPKPDTINNLQKER